MGKYKKTIAHSEKFIPGLEIQTGFSNFSWFYKRVGSISRYSTSNFLFTSICTKEKPITGKKMDFTLEADDEVIRESVSHKFDRLPINSSNKVCKESNQTKAPNSPFQIGDSLRYTN